MSSPYIMGPNGSPYDYVIHVALIARLHVANVPPGPGQTPSPRMSWVGSGHMTTRLFPPRERAWVQGYPFRVRQGTTYGQGDAAD